MSNESNNRKIAEDILIQELGGGGAIPCKQIYQKAEDNNKKPSLLKNLFKNSKGKLIEINFKPSLVLSESHSIRLPEINHGSYEVRWRAVGEDGHVLKGILTFEIKGR